MNVLITISLKRCLKSLKEVQYEVPIMMRASPKDNEKKMATDYTDYTDFFVFFIICVNLCNLWAYFHGSFP
jgi:hypothetical protein